MRFTSSTSRLAAMSASLRSSINVGGAQYAFQREDPGEDPRAHERGYEARALLVGPRHELERRTRAHTALVQRAHHLEPRHDAVGAVELAARGLRVEMAAHQH